MSDNTLLLNCWIIGDPFDNVISILISRSDNVSILRRFIWDRRGRSPTLKLDLDAGSRLRLFKVSVTEEDFNEVLSGVISPSEVSDAQKLSPTDLLSNVFDEPPTKHIHIMVHVSGKELSANATELLALRKAVFGKSDSRFKNSKLQPPSELSKPHEFQKIQQDEHTYFAWSRPEDHEAPLPLALLHPIFGHFTDDLENAELSTEDYDTARTLKTEMCRFYDRGEDARAFSFRRILNGYGIPFMSRSIGSSGTDGHIAYNGCPLLITEIKNEIGSTTSEPSFQALLHYEYLVLESTLWEKPEIYPCFVIVLAGPHIGFGGCAVTERAIMETFSFFSLTFHATNEKSYKMLARHLVALKNAVDRLFDLYTSPTAARTTDMCFPYPNSFIHPTTHQQVSFTYQKSMNGRLVLAARSNSGSPLCVKFVRRYGQDAHQWCAAQGIAPQLLAVQALPGGWQMVVMQRLDPSWDDLNSLPAHPDIIGLRAAIHSCLTRFHENHFVHGDIRDTNIMVKKDGGLEFMLVDFDWAGTIGQTCYPIFLNKAQEVGRPADAEAGKLILPSHDIYMASRLV